MALHTFADIQSWGRLMVVKLKLLLPSLVLGAILFIFFAALAYGVSHILKKRARGDDQHTLIYMMLAKIARLGILAIGFVTLLGTIGVSVSALITSLGLAGFATGLAMKDVLSNLISGLLLLFHRPFKVGDYLVLKDAKGQVVEIDLRFTCLHDGGCLVMIPNNTLLTQPVHVSTSHSDQLSVDHS